MPDGVVVKALNSYYFVQGGERSVRCKLRGRFKKERYSLVVGDRVRYAPLEDGTGIIEDILPRRSVLSRPPVANVDQVIVTFAATDPELNPLLLDRFLVLAEHSRLDIVVCVNKTDLADARDLDRILNPYADIGYEIHRVSAARETGIEPLRARLADKVSVFAGPSGVGKSTLLNALEPGLSLATGAVSEKIRRGRHTTRVAELLPLVGGGFVVDTPGFSFTEFDHIDKMELGDCFIEFRPYREHCKFRNTCLHDHEPQCAVQQAARAGDITKERYEAYLNILNEIKNVKKEF